MVDKQIQEIRKFSRFYTRIIGLLDQHILDSPYSLPEARVLYELHHHHPCPSKKLIEVMDMDKGYLSRVIKSFERRGIISKSSSSEDGRTTILRLTAKGEKEFSKINSASSNQLKDMLSTLSNSERSKLINHMQEIQRILTKEK